MCQKDDLVVSGTVRKLVINKVRNTPGVCDFFCSLRDSPVTVAQRMPKR